MELVTSKSKDEKHHLPIYVGPPDQTAILAYSDRGSAAYEDPENLSSLYGAVTREFLESISFRNDDRFIADIGCGTGFAFDVLDHLFIENKMVGIGVDPAPGMLSYARKKYKKLSRYRFLQGEGEAIPIPENSIDRIISTLALHWVQDLDAAAAEMRRVLKDDGMVEFLIIANEDGFVFKRAILAALKKHLSFAQVIKAAGLVQRLKPEQLAALLEKHFAGFNVQVNEHQLEVDGSTDDHIKWWQARSMPVVADIEDQDGFLETLKAELEAISSNGMITFDAAFLKVRISPR